MEDYYNDLNLSATAPIGEVKKAYRRLAKKYHPDKNLKDHASAQNFLRISRAYEFLKDKEQKEKYDNELIRYKKKANACHHPALVKEYIRKARRSKSKIIFRQKVIFENFQCEKCEGYGLLLSRFSIPATCPQCNGTGKR